MAFDLEKTEQALRDAVKIKEGEHVYWVLAPHSTSIRPTLRHFQTDVTDHSREEDYEVKASLQIPDYKTALHLLGKYGIMDERLPEYLETSFSENRSRYLNISNWHINS